MLLTWVYHFAVDANKGKKMHLNSTDTSSMTIQMKLTSQKSQRIELDKTLEDLICQHRFRVPFERVYPSSTGDSLITRPPVASTETNPEKSSCNASTDNGERRDMWLRMLTKMDDHQ